MTMKKEEATISSLIVDAEMIDRNYRDLMQLDSEIHEAESKLRASSSDSRTLEEVGREYEALQKQRFSFSFHSDTF